MSDQDLSPDAALAEPAAAPERDDATADMVGAPAAAPHSPGGAAYTTGRIAHAFMLTGVRGVGKTTTARLLARAITYESDTVHEPSVTALAQFGRHCQAILDGRHMDVLELDAASRSKVDEMRELDR